MADYIWTESASTSLEVVPHVIGTRFGDGYEQDAPDGLNPQHQEWDLVHAEVERALVDEIEAFILPGLGHARFDWVPLGKTTAIKVKCTSYRKVQTPVWGFFDLSLRFQQVFEP